MNNNINILKSISDTPTFKAFFQDTSELENIEYSSSLQYFSFFWKKYESYKTRYLRDNGKAINNSFNGKIFEAIFAFLLNREDIKIYSHDECVDGVKYVKPDFLIKKNEYYIFLSLKVSMRERWKQADWESVRFKKKYPNTKTIILTTNLQEAEGLSSKISDLDINQICYVLSDDINKLITTIHNFMTSE
jgi:hypothetical protein